MIERIRMLFLFAGIVVGASAFAQSIMIDGTVRLPEDNSGAIGATVVEKGTSNGVVTDLEGSYSIRVSGPNAVLVFSYLGYAKQEIPVAGREQIDVVMQSDLSNLDEIVVVGYGTQLRSNISGAVSTVSAEEISELPVLRVEQALQGRTAGIQIAQNSGSPGAELNVRIRGLGTLNNADPLYIVDGLPVDGLDFLNPNDVETINVLKDAASTAIYGARGANGVVLITTKSGEKNAPGRINYDMYYGVQRAWKKPNLLNAREYAILQNEAYIAAGQTPLPEFANPDALGEGTDWIDAVFSTAPISSHQLSLTGGSSRSSYLVSGNYFQQDGIVGKDKSSFERATVRTGVKHEMKDWLNVGSTLNFTWLTRDALPENNEFNTPLVRALNIDPITPIYKPDGTYAYSQYADTDIVNPVNAIEQNFDTWETYRFFSGFFAEIKPIKNVSIKSTVSTDINFSTSKRFYPSFDLSNDPALGDAPGGETSLANSVTLDNFNWKSVQLENVLTYTPEINPRSDLALIVGNTALSSSYDYSGGANSNLPSNNIDNAYIDNTIDPIESQSATQGREENALLSYFLRVNYELDDKYLVSATFRADGSSRFGANNRFGYFPAVSAGWVFSREGFWKSQLISFAKLRASWGQNGNDRIGDYTFSTVVRSGQNYSFGPDEVITNGSVALEAANPDLKWETSTQTDIGIDMEFWDGKLNITADYFIKNTSDMLYRAPIPLIAGTAAPTQNVGDAKNSGWELSAQYQNKSGALKYNFGGSVDFVSNELTGLGIGSEPVLSGRIQSANAFVSRSDIGQPIASFYGYVTDGIFQDEGEVSSHAFQSEGTSPGDIRFRDLNDDGKIDNEDQQYIGNPTPDFTFGINGNLSYSNFDLGVFIQGVSGNDIYNGSVRYDFTYVNRPVSALERWTGPGTSDSEPRVNLNDPNQNARVSDRFVEDGSYVRIKNVQLGYILPKHILSRVGAQKVRVYVSAQNLYTRTNYSGMDPEIGITGDQSNGDNLFIGIDRGFYPQARTFLVGIQTSF